MVDGYKRHLGSKLSNRLNTLTSAEEHFAFLETVLVLPELDETFRSDTREQIAAIRRRRNDPRLYLAIVGEFNSGKSTFINALLREPLLHTSLVVRTAVTTQIEYGSGLAMYAEFKNRHGRIYVDVPARTIKYIKDGEQFAFPQKAWLLTLLRRLIGMVRDSGATRTLHITIPWAPSQKIGNIGELIHLLTTDEQLAPEVSAMRIFHSAAFLRNQLVVLDTPGFNLAGENGDLHRQETIAAVRERADAVIIIVPSSGSVSLTLSGFIKDNLLDMMHRCIFILSKMDQIRSTTDRDRLVSNVKLRLKGIGGMDLSVQVCSAEGISGGGPLWRRWFLRGEQKLRYQEFVALEEEMLKRLKAGRTQYIAERILHLLDEVLCSLNNHLTEQDEIYCAKQEAIGKELIPSFKTFYEEQLRTVTSSITIAASKARTSITTIRENRRAKLVSLLQASILSSQNLGELNEKKGTINTALAKYESGLLSGIDACLGPVYSATTAALAKYDAAFQDDYRRLQLAAYAEDLPKPVFTPSEADALDSLKKPKTTNVYMDVASPFLVAIGGGAGIGATFAGPVGAAIGAMLGLLFAFFNRPSQDDLNLSAWTATYQRLTAYFVEVDGHLDRALDVTCNGLVDQARGHVQWYVTQYSELLDLIENQQAVELKRVTEFRATVNSNSVEIERRRVQIQRELAALQTVLK